MFYIFFSSFLPLFSSFFVTIFARTNQSENETHSTAGRERRWSKKLIIWNEVYDGEPWPFFLRMLIRKNCTYSILMLLELSLKPLKNDLSLTAPDSEVLSQRFCFLYSSFHGSQVEATVLYRHCEGNKKSFSEMNRFYFLTLSTGGVKKKKKNTVRSHISSCM